jgi:DNA processing protein
MNERARAVLRLHLTHQVGALTYQKLLRVFGSPEAALAAPERRLAEVEGIGPKSARTITASRARSAEAADRELELAARHGVRILTLEDEAYPRALSTIFDPPLVLYVKGEILPRDGLALGVVGSRRSSYYGRSQAERIASHMAGLGFTIVSGLARGVDSAAHRGAVAAGGRTFAVLGNGLCSIYPPENAELGGQVAASGALLSEFPMEVEPHRENFPRRNRIISGLSMGVLVVEGNVRSGALITAHAALEQGREVFALPGKVDSPLARGPHSLIKLGAKLVEGPADILDEIGPSADALGLADAAQGTPAEGALPDADGEGTVLAETQEARLAAGGTTSGTQWPGLAPAERRLLECLSSDARDIDDITAAVEMSPAEVSAGLLVLEIRRLVKQLPGKRFVRAR